MVNSRVLGRVPSQALLYTTFSSCLYALLTADTSSWARRRASGRVREHEADKSWPRTTQRKLVKAGARAALPLAMLLSGAPPVLITQKANWVPRYPLNAHTGTRSES